MGQGAGLDQLLRDGLEQQGISASQAQRETLLAYTDLLLKWNRTHNLTAITEPKEVVSKHLLDSLSMLPVLPEGDLLDVGTGAGFPGLPIAVMQPSRSVVLLDSSSKKTAFLLEVKRQFALTNIEVVCARVEAYSGQRFPLITARAFAATAELLAATSHLLDDGGRWVLMKGRYPATELAALGEGFDVESQSMHVAGLDGERHLLWIHPSRNTV